MSNETIVEYIDHKTNVIKDNNLHNELIQLYNQPIITSLDDHKVNAIINEIDRYFPSVFELKQHISNGYDKYRIFSKEISDIYETNTLNNYKKSSDDYNVIGFETNYYLGRHKINIIDTFCNQYIISDKITIIDHDKKLIPVIFIWNYLINKINDMGFEKTTYDNRIWMNLIN